MLGHRMRHRVTIQQPVNAQDAETGENTVTWTDVLTDVAAEVFTGPGREAREAGAMQAETTLRVTVRWFDGLEQDMRVLWDGKTYNIKTFITDRTARRFYFIDCADEGINQG